MLYRSVRNVVKHRLTPSLSSDTFVAEAARLMQRTGVGAVNVVDGEKLVGIFTERDALYRVVARGRDGGTTTLGEVMTPAPETIGPNSPFAHALHRMYEGGFRHLPVVENGRPIGMVCARDMLGPELAEFVGELRQKSDIAEILG